MKQKKEKRDERKPRQSIRCIVTCFLEAGQKKGSTAVQPRARQSEYGDTSILRKGQSGSRGEASLDSASQRSKNYGKFVARICGPNSSSAGIKPGSCSGHGMAVHSSLDQAKEGLHQTLGLLIRVYKAPQE